MLGLGDCLFGFGFSLQNFQPVEASDLKIELTGKVGSTGLAG